MAFEFLFPDIGEGLTEATIIRWLAAVGEEVALDQPIVEVETDKAVVEIPAPHPGAILHHGGAEGEVIAVGSLLVVIGGPDEAWEPGEAGSIPAAAPIVGTLRDEEDQPAVEVGRAEVAVPGQGQMLPLVRRRARMLGVELAGVTGTGPGGRVTVEDVEAAAALDVEGERVRMSPLRRAIARNLARSWREIPHVTTYGEADAAGLLDERRRLADELDAPVPLEALLIDAVTPLLAEHRDFNAAVAGDDVVYRTAVHVGFAVDTPDGLLVAVVRDADQLDLPALAAETRRLAEGGRGRTLGPSETRGATFTISNIGAVGGRFGTPIIPLGTSAILSVGRADPRPVVEGGVVVVGRRFPLSLSYDHRLIDGAAGRAFLGAVIDAIENR